MTLTVGGIEARVNRLRSREFLSLMRVLTRGIGTGAKDLKFEGDADAMRAQFIGLFIVAVPNAVPEFAQFLLTVVEPIDPSQRGLLAREMDNPEIEVMLDVFEIIATQEKDDLSSLVGKARAALSRIQSLYTTAGR